MKGRSAFVTESVSKLTDPASPCEKAVLCGWWSKVAVSVLVEASALCTHQRPAFVEQSKIDSFPRRRAQTQPDVESEGHL